MALITLAGPNELPTKLPKVALVKSKLEKFVIVTLAGLESGDKSGARAKSPNAELVVIPEVSAKVVVVKTELTELVEKAIANEPELNAVASAAVLVITTDAKTAVAPNSFFKIDIQASNFSPTGSALKLAGPTNSVPR